MPPWQPRGCLRPRAGGCPASPSTQRFHLVTRAWPLETVWRRGSLGPGNEARLERNPGGRLRTDGILLPQGVVSADAAPSLPRSAWGACGQNGPSEPFRRVGVCPLSPRARRGVPGPRVIVRVPAGGARGRLGPRIPPPWPQASVCPLPARREGVPGSPSCGLCFQMLWGLPRVRVGRL